MKLGVLTSLFGLSFSAAAVTDRSDADPSSHESAPRAVSSSNTTDQVQHLANECAREGGSVGTCYPSGNVPGNGQIPVVNPVKAFDMTCNSNLATYWGQNSYGAVNSTDTVHWQQTLSYYCASSPATIFPIAFLDNYFDTGGLPHIDLTNRCSVSANGAFPGTNLANCGFLGPDIKACQALGKVVTLAIGGQSGRGSFTSDAQATAFADTIWNLFLGGSSSTRPFGTAVLDGVDLDIESGSQSYAAFVTRLRTHFTGASKNYYVTAAPQCPFPDAALSSTLNAVSLDAVFVQFYNNPGCGLNNFDHASQSFPANSFNFGTWDFWARNNAPNKNIKIFIGGPGASGASGSGYVSSTSDMAAIIQQTRQNFPASFGGVSFWDASQAYNNGNSAISNYVYSAGQALTAAGARCGGSYVLKACSSGATAWSSSTQYQGNALVTYKGYQFQAAWWTQGNNPDPTTATSNVWILQFACSTSGSTTVSAAAAKRTDTGDDVEHPSKRHSRRKRMIGHSH